MHKDSSSKSEKRFVSFPFHLLSSGKQIDEDDDGDDRLFKKEKKSFVSAFVRCGAPLESSGSWGAERKKRITKL